MKFDQLAWWCLPLLLAAAPPEISADQLLIDARALITLGGEEAVSSPEAAALRTRLVDAGRAARAQIEADLASGKLSNVCLPAPGTTQISLGELVKGLEALTTEQRAKPLSQGMALYLAQRFSCAAH